MHCGWVWWWHKWQWLEEGKQCSFSLDFLFIKIYLWDFVVIICMTAILPHRDSCYIVGVVVDPTPYIHPTLMKAIVEHKEIEMHCGWVWWHGYHKWQWLEEGKQCLFSLDFLFIKIYLWDFVVIICMTAILPHMGWYLTQVHSYSLWLCYVNIPHTSYWYLYTYVIMCGKQTIDGNQDSLLHRCLCIFVHEMQGFKQDFELGVGENRISLIPRPRPAFCHLHYGKAWSAWYLFSHEHDIIGKWWKFWKQTGCISRIFQPTTPSTLGVYDNCPPLAR